MSKPAAARKPQRSGSVPGREHWLPVSDLEFVGCDVRPMTVADYEAHEGRVEFFDSESGRAWMVCEPAGFGHETPSATLARLAERIAQARGAPITCHGESELRLLDPASRQFRSMQPDQLLFLRQDFEDPQNWRFLAVGQGPYPDVVLEVDHTTDVRKNRLKIYEEWQFPEVWVEVPEAWSPSRPRGRKSGLDIHLLEEGRFIRSPVSRAFPGWQATEIHRALNERFLSAETAEVLTRVGRALGEPEGTGPDDDPVLGRFGRERQAVGRIEGRAEGRAETVEAMARGFLRQRGVELPAKFPEGLSSEDRAVLLRATPEAVAAAAVVATTFPDFIGRLRQPDS